MNKKLLSVLSVLVCGATLQAWQIDTAKNLKFFHDGQLVLEETEFSKVSLSGNPATAGAPFVSVRRSVEKKNDDFKIVLTAVFDPLDFMPTYRMRIPEAILEGAKLNAIGIVKRARREVEIPKDPQWQLDNIVFLSVKRENVKFALDFEWTGSSAFQHYRDEVWSASLRRDANGLEIVLARREYLQMGGYYRAEITLRTGAMDYTRLHGAYQAHYKRPMPVTRFFTFSPLRQRPILFGGIVDRDDDVKAYTKRFVKAAVIPIKHRIPRRYGFGGWNFPKELRFHANETENPVYAYALGGGAKTHEFVMYLPDGYYFLTFHVRDDSVVKPYEYRAVIDGGPSCTIPVRGAEPTAVRYIVKVENGRLKIKFPAGKKSWSLSAISAVWLAGIADLDIVPGEMKGFLL